MGQSFWLTDLLFGAGWNTAKNVYRGARGKKEILDDAGNVVQTISPRDRLIQDLKSAREAENALAELEGRMVSPLWQDIKYGTYGILGQGLQMLGWTGGVAGTAVGAVAAPVGIAAGKLAKHTAVGTGKALYGAADQAVDMALNASELIGDMTNSRIGQTVLFATPIVGAGVIGGFKEGQGFIVNSGLKAYIGSNAEALPGTTAEASEKRLDNLGADGSLVFAMHNLR